MSEPKKPIRVRYGKMYLKITDIDSDKLVGKYKVTKVSEIAPLVVLCEERDYYVRGMGIILETEDNKRYAFQLISIHAYCDPESILRLYNFRAIVDYKKYGEILALVRGWKITSDIYHRLIFAEGSKLIGSGVLVEEEEFEYRNCEGVKVPIYIYYPNKREKEIMYPTYLQIVPYNSRYIYKLEIEPEEDLVEVEDVIIPGFALI